MTDRTTSRIASFAAAVTMTLAMLAGTTGLAHASAHQAAQQIAATSTSSQA
jgi:hypothetical protein